MARVTREFDIPIPLRDVVVQWRRLQARRRAEVRFSPIDEQHTRAEVSAEDAADVDQVLGDLAAAGLGGAPGPGGKPGTTP